MAYDSIPLGPVPSDEVCQQVGTANYSDYEARQECLRYIELLEKLFPPVEGARYGISRNPHDFGVYYEVVINFDTTNPAAVEYTFHVDANAPSNWNADDEVMQ